MASRTAREASSLLATSAARDGSGSTATNAKGSMAWFVVDPPDGKIPPLTPEARARQAARAEARKRSGRGPADSYTDRSLYDRCISRGVPGSMMPAIYGNSYQIVQAPGFVVIRYEMIHEARVIPLDGSTHLPAGIRSYMGDARGRWEGTRWSSKRPTYETRSRIAVPAPQR